MKISTIVCLFFSILITSLSQTVDVTVGWDAPTENTDGSPLTDLAGFRVYYGLTSGVYTVVSPLIVPEQYTTTNLNMETTYYFAVTALDTSGNESDFSEELERKRKVYTPDVAVTPYSAGKTLITVTNNSENATIFVTIDGTEPSTNSIEYIEPFIVTNSLRVQVVAIKPDFRNSTIITNDILLPSTPTNVIITPP